eukprot:3176619-Amphidinium_carterae.2
MEEKVGRGSVPANDIGDGLALECLDGKIDFCHRETVLALVKQSGLTLRWAAEAFRGDIEIVNVAVLQNWQALQFAHERCKADHNLVLAAVQQNGLALRWASESCQSDREIVLVAVKQDGLALRWASQSCRSDREIVLAAVTQADLALSLAADELLEDSTFATSQKQQWCVLKVSLLSGRSCCIPLHRDDLVHICTFDVITTCCRRLGVKDSFDGQLLCGGEILPDVNILEWPEPPRCGGVSEYQLVLWKAFEVEQEDD